MKTHLIIPAAIVALGISVLGLFIKVGIDRFVDRDRVVTVRGLCEKEVAANKVTWPIVTKEMGNDLGTIYTKIQNTNAVILKFLKDNGIPEAEITVNPPKVYDMAANRYGGDAVGPQFRYQVTNVIVVTSAQVSKVQSLIQRQTELLRQDIAIVAGDYDYQTTYEYTDLNSIKPGMIAEATASAREAAERFAEDSHSEIGQIKTASQGQFAIEDRDQYTPQIKTVRVVTSITYYLQD